VGKIYLHETRIGHYAGGQEQSFRSRLFSKKLVRGDRAPNNENKNLADKPLAKRVPLLCHVKQILRQSRGHC